MLLVYEIGEGEEADGGEKVAGGREGRGGGGGEWSD